MPFALDELEDVAFRVDHDERGPRADREALPDGVVAVDGDGVGEVVPQMVADVLGVLAELARVHADDDERLVVVLLLEDSRSGRCACS